VTCGCGAQPSLIIDSHKPQSTIHQ